MENKHKYSTDVWFKRWKETGRVRGLPKTLAVGTKYKGFLSLSCRFEHSPFFGFGIIGLDDNLNAKEFLGVYESVGYETELKNVSEEDFTIKRILDAKYVMSSFVSDKYKFAPVYREIDGIDYCIIHIVK